MITLGKQQYLMEIKLAIILVIFKDAEQAYSPVCDTLGSLRSYDGDAEENVD